jgi:hypothetical protein
MRSIPRRARTRLAAALILAGALSCAFAGAAAADPLAHGHTIQVAPGHAAVNANQSTNWFGYNQGAIEQGGKLFNSISGDWTVPTAGAHKRGQAAYSSDWIGIGGGCVDASCLVGDATLIQTGTEQDVDSAGHASYSAWWELIPGPSITITGMAIRPGNRMHADISEVVPNSNVWTITLKNVTTGKSFTQTVPYSSTHATAEWIEETPLIIDTSGSGFAPLPNLTRAPFDNAKTNGKLASLKASEQIQLIDANTAKVIGAPSNPDSDKDGFAACAWATTCAVPGT